VLAENWLQNMKECICELPESPTTVKKGILEVAIEFCQLIEPSMKPPKEKTQKLTTYLEFYGNQVVDVERYSGLVEELFASAKKVMQTVEGFRKFEESVHIKRIQKRFKDLKRIYKETQYNHCVTKSKKFVFFEHIVTALFFADVTSCEKSNVDETINIIKSMRELSIDNCKFSEDNKSEPSKIELEMEKIQSAVLEVFSPELLNSVFAFMDCVTAENPRTKRFAKIGRFIVVVLEINADHLNKIHKALGIENEYPSIIIRVLQPYSLFYSALYQAVLKFGISYLCTVTKKDFCSSVKRQMKEEWKGDMILATEFFLHCGKLAAKETKDQGERKFFEVLRARLMQGWERDIVQRAQENKKKKLDSEPDSNSQNIQKQ
jgi:hypothetical protein